jgi:hypothetical protein
VAKTSTKGGGSENINHFAGWRLRVIGNGNLKSTIGTLNDVITKDLFPMPMTDPARIEPYRIINFMSQRAAIEYKTTELDEWFQINTLVIFIKPVFTQYPT